MIYSFSSVLTVFGIISTYEMMLHDLNCSNSNSIKSVLYLKFLNIVYVRPAVILLLLLLF